MRQYSQCGALASTELKLQATCVCDGLGRPIILLLTEGPMSDHKGAAMLVPSLLHAKVLIGDRGYDSDHFRKALAERSIVPCIPPGRHRTPMLHHKVQLPYRPTLNRQRHKIENLFRTYQGLATRYDRCAHTFMSAICIASTICYWL